MRNDDVLYKQYWSVQLLHLIPATTPLKCQRFVFTHTSESIAMANTISNIRLCILSTSFHIKPIPWRSRCKRYHWDTLTWILTSAINFLQIGCMSDWRPFERICIAFNFNYDKRARKNVLIFFINRKYFCESLCYSSRLYNHLHRNSIVLFLRIVDFSHLSNGCVCFRIMAAISCAIRKFSVDQRGRKMVM